MKIDYLFFTWTDVKLFFLARLRKILLVGCLSGILFFLVFLTRPVKYCIESSYRQSSKNKEFSLNMKEIFEHFIEVGGDHAPIAIMQSNEVLQSMIEDLGLQVEPARRGYLAECLHNMKENLHLLWHKEVDDPDSFSFTHVSYEGKKPLSFYVAIEGEIYRLYDSDKKFFGSNKVGSALTFPQGHLTVEKTPKNLKEKQLYPFVVSPLLSATEQVKAKLKIYPHKIDRNILQFTFFHRDRYLGAICLNHLIQSYHLYLKKENHEICTKQLEYLQQRRDELTHYYNEALQEHENYLSQNLEREGFMGFGQEIETLSAPKNAYTAKLFDIDLELQRLYKTEGRSVKLPSSQEIEHVGRQIIDAKTLLENVEAKEPLFSLIEDPKTAIALLVQQIASASDPRLYEPALKEMISQLEQKQAILQEDFDLKTGGFDAFSGLSAVTAQGLLTDYTKQRDGLEAEVSALIFLREQLFQADFEMSCLGAVLDDAVTREIVNRSSIIALQLKDQENRSTKEHERLKEALQTQKNFLSKYLFQTISLKQLRVKLLADKIDSLRQTVSSLLKAEKQFLSHELQELNAKMRVLPEKWRRESLLQLQKELGAVMLQGVAELVEAKSLGQHTFQIGSRPLDKAVAPLQPVMRKSGRLSVAGGCAGGLTYFLFLFVTALLRGLPVSDEMLRRLKYPFSGKLSTFCSAPLKELPSQDLKTLRRAISKLQGKVLLYLAGNYPNCSCHIAELLHLSGRKILIIEYSGLCHYLMGQMQELPIVTGSCYDRICGGSYFRHAHELFTTLKCREVIEELKKRYDTILLYSNAPLTSEEGFACAKMAESAIIVVQQESKEQIEPYLELDIPLSFIYAEKA